MAVTPQRLCIAALLLWIAADWQWKADLWVSSAQWTQAVQTQGGLRLAFKAIATGSVAVTILPQAVGYYLATQERGITLVLVTALGATLPSLLKAVYADPRPYWEFDSVEAISCEVGWGNPSGHALFTGSVWLTLGLYSLQAHRPLLALSILAWVLLIGYDRVFLGVHFYSQIVLGWLLASVIALTAVGIDRKPAGFLSRREVVHCHIASALYLAVAVLLYVARRPRWDERWTQRIEEKCGFVYTVTDAKASSLIETSFFAFFPGVICAAYCTRQSSVALSGSVRTRVKTVGLAVCGILLQATLRNFHTALLCKRRLLQWPWTAWALATAGCYAAGVMFAAAPTIAGDTQVKTQFTQLPMRRCD